MAHQALIQLIRDRLTEYFKPTHLDVLDESAKHKGHAGAANGASHVAITLASPLFENKSLLEKQRMVYSLLEDLIPAKIHALKLKTL